MLVGSKAKEITKYKLNSLSTFGLLSSLSEPQAAALIDALLSARLLQQVEERPHRPLLRLTPRGEEVMKGAAAFDDPLPLDEQLLLRLRVIAVQPQRQNRASAAEAAPNHTAAAPEKSDADNFDDLNALLAADDIPAETIADTSPLTRPSHYWTWRVLNAGFSLQECQQIRALDRTAIFEHLLAAARAGENIPLDSILTTELQAQLARLAYNGAPTSLDSLLSRLPPTISPLEAELYFLTTTRTAPSHS
jgi:RQC domain/Helix-turn-helix domain